MGLLACATPAFAQRGELDTPPQPRETSRLDGFPGTFNAAMPARGEWQLEVGLPSALSYGIHDDASVSISLLPPLGWLTGSPAGGAELRYRLWHDQRLALVGSFGGVVAQIGDVDMRWVKAALTGEWRYSHRSALALTVLAGGGVMAVHEKVDDSQMATTTSGLSVQGIGVMASYSFFPASWFGFDLGLGVAPRLDASMLGTGGSQSIDLDQFVEASHGLGGRLTLYIKPGRTWLIHLGAVVLPPAVPVPTLGVAKRW